MGTPSEVHCDLNLLDCLVMPRFEAATCNAFDPPIYTNLKVGMEMPWSDFRPFKARASAPTGFSSAKERAFFSFETSHTSFFSGERTTLLSSGNRGRFFSLQKGLGHPLFSIDRTATLLLYSGERMSLVSIERRGRLLLYREESVTPFSIERRSAPSLVERSRVSVFDREERDSSAIERRKCCSSLERK